MNKVFEEFKKTHKPDPINREGYVWLSMLIKYDLDGNAIIVRSFTKPAKESTIKNLKKEVKNVEKIEIDKEDDSSNLF